MIGANAGYKLVLQTQSLPASARRANLAEVTNPSIVKRCLVGTVLAIAATLPGFQQLHTSVEGLKLIADYEGCRLQPYQCSAGVWTDGIGNTSGVIPGKTITERQAAEGLISNVLRVERVLERCVKQQPPQKVYDAVVSFAFNVGTGNACSSTLVKLLNQRRWADACRQLPRWVYVKGVLNASWITAVRGRWPGVYREQTEMKKKLISGLFLMLWMALLIAAMVYPQGIFPVLATFPAFGSLFADMGGNSGSTGCVHQWPALAGVKGIFAEDNYPKRKRIYQLGDAIADCR